MEQTLLNILNSLCNSIIEDGTIPEEVMDMLVAAGANLDVLKAIGFTDEEISDYAYYVGMSEHISQEEAMRNLLQL